jgi:hypothetical protein
LSDGPACCSARPPRGVGKVGGAGRGTLLPFLGTVRGHAGRISEGSGAGRGCEGAVCYRRRDLALRQGRKPDLAPPTTPHIERARR